MFLQIATATCVEPSPGFATKRAAVAFAMKDTVDPDAISASAVITGIRIAGLAIAAR